ncbi:MAG: hypothetical protein PR2021_0930 [Candidatus Phytoplasma pruni]|uniref:hypothetical protein n=1 Tax=Poinsettia branch-inducing phytoplasma TaxID=138647 RepID=UPI000376CB57|nr:hypothetical protein [Poinsettia branch-inducing phytoplasma]WEK82167.1 MAG: hypothetical protein PR2021_0930 [Candidatus Phytoplasma pruni]
MKSEIKEEYFEAGQDSNFNRISQKYPIDKSTQIGEIGSGEYKYALSLPNSDYVLGTPIIDITYTCFGFNGLDKCQYPDKVPTDLKAFVKQKPFNKWYYRDESLHWNKTQPNCFDGVARVPQDLDSVKNNSLFTQKNTFRDGVNINTSDYSIKIDYKGPKYILDMDKDFYLRQIKIPKDNLLGNHEEQTYYLHFNPVKQYITLYTEPMNNSYYIK